MKRLPGAILLPTLSCLMILFLDNAGAAASQPGPCQDGDAVRAAEKLSCASSGQVERITSYQQLLALSKTAPDQHSMREALLGADKLASCINDTQHFPTDTAERQDFRCLQRRLLDFYEQVRSPATEPDLHFQDILAHASLRIHYCMIDQDLSLPACLELVHKSLGDYQSVFATARKAREEMRSEAEPAPELSGKDGEDRPAAPGVADLRSFVDLSLENSRRFPRLIGKPFGKALGGVLCDAYRLYPEERLRITYLYNLLIRFDFGSIGSSSRLYQFMERLKEFLRPNQSLPSFLNLQPADWSPSPIPCSAENDWVVYFPEFLVRPGYYLPARPELDASLQELEALLLQVAELAEMRNFVWKPFDRYGNLLLQLADNLRIASGRDPKIWETRHLLMQKARDTFVLRGVAAEKYPLDPAELHASITRQLEGYGVELLAELQFARLQEFAEDYLKEGERLLTPEHQLHLHRLLAIAYSVQGDSARALTNLQKSDLKPAQLEELLKGYRRMGIGVLSKPQ